MSTSQSFAFQRKISDILVLQGVFLKDFTSVEDLFDQRLMEQAGIRHSTVTIYDEIPDYFTTFDEWITSTNLKCWGCDLVPDGIPIPSISDVFIDKNGKQKMRTEGIFCEFNCAEKYVDGKYRHDPSWDNRKRFLRVLYRIMKGKSAEIIKPSPDKTIREEYCGSKRGIKANEYRSLINSLNAEYELVKYKIEHFKDTY